MADAPWRCSQCGTVNEPVANACRTCGRWPSLFELEGSTIDPSAPPEGEDVYAAETVQVEAPTVEPEVFEPPVEAELPPEFEPELEDEGDETARRRGWQRLARFIVPVGIALYILISALANRGG